MYGQKLFFIRNHQVAQKRWLVPPQYCGRLSSVQTSHKKGKLTVPHPKKDLNISVIASIKKQSGLTI